MSSSKLLVGLLILYTLGLNSLLLIHFTSNNFAHKDVVTIAMGSTLFVLWVLVLGSLMRRNVPTWTSYIAKRNFSSPFVTFVCFATLFALTEEAIATTITNLAPLYGVALGEAYITASANFFRVITFHSVIVFIPMFVVLGLILKRYAISPFGAFLLFGGVGVLAEFTFAGPQVILNAPAWILIYGLMVYLPAHIFSALPNRKKIHPLLLPLFIPFIAFSAIFTAWIPSVLDIPKIEFTSQQQ